MEECSKTTITLALDTSLVEAARAHDLNLSAIAEEALRTRIAQENARLWLVENSEAIAAQNAWTAERGLLSDEFQEW